MTIRHRPTAGPDRPRFDQADDRRAHRRTRVKRPGKLYDPRADKYYPCSTCDVSASGVLLELESSIAARPGDMMQVGIAETRRQPLLRHHTMAEATVVRLLRGEDGRVLLAAEFADRLADREDCRRFAA